MADVSLWRNRLLPPVKRISVTAHESLAILFLVEIFVAITLLVSVIGVLVFVGLTAYDTQRIKQMYLESDTAEIADKKAVLGALALYLDFINLFMMLLQLFGQRREN